MKKTALFATALSLCTCLVFGEKAEKCNKKNKRNAQTEQRTTKQEVYKKPAKNNPGQMLFRQLKKDNPQEFQRLKQLRADNLQKFREEINRLATRQQMQQNLELQNQQIAALNQKLNNLRIQLKQSDKPEEQQLIKEKFRATIGEIFDTRMKRQEESAQNLEARLIELKKRIINQKAHKDVIINKEMARRLAPKKEAVTEEQKNQEVPGQKKKIKRKNKQQKKEQNR